MRLPTEAKEVRLHPDLARPLSAMLEPYKGKKRESADAAVVQTLRSGIRGAHSALLDSYSKAIADATGDTQRDVMSRVPGYVT